MRLALTLLFLLLLPALASAEQRHCRAVVNGTETVVSYYSDTLQPVTPGERLLRLPARTWNWAWGRPPPCNSEALITTLAANLPLADIDGFCLTEIDGLEGFLLVPGERNFRGRCKVTVCERVNATAEDVTRAANDVADFALNPDPGTGVTGLLHSTGAAILTGKGGGLFGAVLSDAGAGIAAALAGPGVATAAAVSVVAFGGAVYVCKD